MADGSTPTRAVATSPATDSSPMSDWAAVPVMRPLTSPVKVLRNSIATGLPDSSTSSRTCVVLLISPPAASASGWNSPPTDPPTSKMNVVCPLSRSCTRPAATLPPP